MRMHIEELIAIPKGGTVVDTNGVEWVHDHSGDGWHTEIGIQVGDSGELMATNGPITIGVQNRIELTGRDAAWFHENAPAEVILLLMSDGTVRWDQS